MSHLPNGLLTTTIAKVAANAALRMPYVFLLPISKGLHTSVGRLGAVLGIGELFGLATLFIGRGLDAGGARRWLLIGCSTTTVGALVMATAPSALWFGFGFAFAASGVAWFTTAAHTWLGHHVAYHERSRAIGVFETSWALALLLGAPLFGLLIAQFRWWTPFAGLTVVLLAMIGSLIRSGPDTSRVVTDSRPYPSGITVAQGQTSTSMRAESGESRAIVGTLLASFAITFAAVSLFSVYGTWLENDVSLSTRVIGAFSVAIGVAELAASSGTAVWTDRIGKRTAVLLGSAVMMCGTVPIVANVRTPVTAIAALVVVFLGFEFAFVSLLSAVTEVGGAKRGRVVAIDHSISVIARAGAAALATGLYDAQGVRIPAAIALGTALVAALSLGFATPLRTRSA